MQKATFGAGCFWQVEEAFRKVIGVVDVTVGYAGGNFENPTYKDVCTGKTGHAEAVEVSYDTKKVSYKELLKVFWSIHNPTTLNRQGFDIGTQYRSVIFYHNEKQKQEVIKSKEEHQKTLSKKIATEIEAAKKFYRAEEYHQRYLEKQEHLSPIKRFLNKINF